MTLLESLQKMTRLDSSRCTNDSDSTLVTRPLRLKLGSRLEPLADNLIIFMKKYDLERASCVHDIFEPPVPVGLRQI